MRCLPTFTRFGTTICDADFEAGGITLSIRWGRFVFEICFARGDR